MSKIDTILMLAVYLILKGMCDEIYTKPEAAGVRRGGDGRGDGCHVHTLFPSHPASKTEGE